MTTQIERDEETKRRVSAAMAAVPAVDYAKVPPPTSDLIVLKPKRPLGPHNAVPSQQQEKEEETKRRNSLEIKALPPEPSQVEKDEETKRRVSVAMRPTEPGAVAIPPMQLVGVQVPPSPSKPSMESQMDKEEETKRRVSLSQMKSIEQVDNSPKIPTPPTPSEVPADKKPSPKLQPESPLPPSTDNLIVPASAGSTEGRESVSVVAFPKARGGTVTPPTSSPVVLTSAILSNKRKDEPLPLMPSVVDMEQAKDRKQPRVSLPPPRQAASSPHRQLGQKKQRVSLPNASILAAAGKLPPKGAASPARGNSPHRQLGKHRVSLPNAASLAPAPKAITPSSSPVGQKHRLGDRKTRVSLPPSMPRVLDGSSPERKQQAPVQNHQQQRASMPPPQAGHSPVRPKHRLGERKTRVSLPPSMMPGTALAALEHSPVKERTQRASLPPSMAAGGGPRRPRASLSSALLHQVGPQPPQASTSHRQLGEKKSNRVSLPNMSTTFLDSVPSASSLSSGEDDQEGKKEEEEQATNAHPNKGDGLPQKGLRHNNSARRLSSAMPVPNIAGPGAFFVPFEALTSQDVEQRTSIRRLSSSSFSSLPGGSNSSSRELKQSDSTASMTRGSSRELHPQQPDATISSNSNDVDSRDEEIVVDLEAGCENTTASEFFTQDISSAFSSRPQSEAGSPRRKSRKQQVNDDYQEEEKKWNLRLWCNILVPLLLVAACATVITFVVKKYRKKNAESAVATLAPTQPPAPLVSLFDNESMAPTFTLEALKNPRSPQSKARDWLLADPNAYNYTQAQKTQRFALATLYHSANGARWKNSTNWLSYEHHECLWFSARDEAMVAASDNTTIPTANTNASICNEDMEYEYLLLAADSLLGEMPAEISLLTSLVDISLSSNKLYSTIPSQIGSLTKLTSLGLSMNEFEGNLPSELGLLTVLEIFYLRENLLTGTPPTELAQLTRLKEFHLTQNRLTGTIPTILSRLSRLETLRLGGNKFVGPIQTELGLLTNLRMLNVGGNNLQMGIPTEIGALSQLTFFGIASNKQMNGTMPTELARLTNLETFFATSAGLRGSIPSQIGLMTNLVALSLASNRLSSSIPSEVGLLSNLDSLFFYDNNRLVGGLPTELGNLSRLSIFHTFVTQLDSTIPTEFGMLSSLKELHVFDTLLSGELPLEIVNLSNLKELFIQNTELSGAIPNATCLRSSSQQLLIKADCNQMVCCAA